MLKTFAIIKETDKVKTKEGWKNAFQFCGYPFYQTIITTIVAKNRREAWKIYQSNLSKTYNIDNRSLTAERYNHNKKRRIELIRVIEIDKRQRTC